MRRGEGLVQVQVHNVKAHIPGTDHAHERIHVGAVIVKQAAGSVNQRCDGPYFRLKQTQRVGVGHHDAGYLVREQRL